MRPCHLTNQMFRYLEGMSNLGGYQTLVTWTKRLGGPKRATFLTFSAIAGTSVIGTKACDWVRGQLRKQDDTAATQAASGSTSEKDLRVYTVHDEVDCGEGLVLEPADTFVVFSRDRDTAFIRVRGRADNPFAVSAQLLANASDFEF